jgi:hypothetical protein
MHLVFMDQVVHEEITAATAVHQELGPAYGDAVAEGLVERIGAEIDKRVDARLGQRGSGTLPPAPVPPPSRPAVAPVAMGLGSIAGGLLVAGFALKGLPGPATGHAVFIAFAWLFILVINLVYARRR